MSTEAKHKHGCLYSQAFGTACSCGEEESAAAQPPPDPSPTPWDYSTWGFYCDACKTFFDLLTDGLTVTHERNTCTRYHRCGSQARYIGYDHKVVPPAWGMPMWTRSRNFPAAETAMTAEQLAQLFHETYERLAPQFGYKTREASAKPWADVPEQNKKLMIAVCAEMGAHVREAAQGEIDLQPLQDVCERQWAKETPRQVIAIAANAIYWRGENIKEYAARFVQANERAETAERKLAELEKARTLPFRCKARTGNTGANDPQDCDFPNCGCAAESTNRLKTLLCNAAQLIDGFKQFAVPDGEWSEWDESVRQEISAMQRELE